MLTVKHISATLFTLAGFIALSGCAGQGRYQSFGGYSQGGMWQVKANTAGVKVRNARIQRGIEAILEDVDSTLSGYNMGSQLSRLNAGDTIVPSAMLCRVYDRAYRLWEETDGALDCAAGPLYDIWGFGFKGGGFPDSRQIAEAMAISGMRRLKPRMEDAMRGGLLHASWLLVEGGSPVEPGMTKGAEKAKGPGRTGNLPRLNFNAIAQGYSCDTVAAYLDGLGVKDMLVDIGEIWCRGKNASGKPWRIGIDRPTDGNDTPGADLDGIWESAADSQPAGQGLVTSGNYRKFFVHDGKKYSHTIDPRTGYPSEAAARRPGAEVLLSATIVAPTAELADAYATYCMVIGLDAAARFIESRPELEGFLIYDSNGSMAEWRSPGFNLAGGSDAH